MENSIPIPFFLFKNIIRGVFMLKTIWNFIKTSIYIFYQCMYMYLWGDSPHWAANLPFICYCNGPKKSAGAPCKMSGGQQRLRSTLELQCHPNSPFYPQPFLALECLPSKLANSHPKICAQRINLATGHTAHPGIEVPHSFHGFWRWFSSILSHPTWGTIQGLFSFTL